MTRKVSIWLVIALVGALAATTAAVVVLATHDRVERRAERGLPSADGSSHGWPDTQGDRRLPVMGDMRGGWDGGRDSPVLPWVLFAVSTGTVVGLLVAWRPWRTAPAVPNGPDGVGGARRDAATPAPTATMTSAEPSAGAGDTQATEEVVEAPAAKEDVETPAES